MGLQSLEDYRVKTQLSYRSLAQALGFSENKTYRLCNNNYKCLKLTDAMAISRVTGIEISKLVGDC